MSFPLTVNPIKPCVKINTGYVQTTDYTYPYLRGYSKVKVLVTLRTAIRNTPLLADSDHTKPHRLHMKELASM